MSKTLKHKYPIEYNIPNNLQKKINRTPINTCINCNSTSLYYVNCIHSRVKFCKDCITKLNIKLGWLRVITGCKKCSNCGDITKNFCKTNTCYLCNECYIIICISKKQYTNVLNEIRGLLNKELVVYNSKLQNKINKVTACNILKINLDYTYEELRKSFIKLSLENHPDKGGNESKFIEIYEMYKYLLKSI